MIEIINQIFALESKLIKTGSNDYTRNFDRIASEFENLNYHVINPIGKPYRNEMTDVEASISGDLNKNSKITKVLKPIIYQIDDNETKLVQKGIVIVE
ncbi:hypothetical protein [Winogradskyella algicola]|uniref:hypothetical protein n=1 Tax=Winogradskyella algicola TaxID=2575815 RepID=UPI0011085CC0|nr:hypothetical protein [Winogradskyella algicola]